jgi:hypothetical protein
MAAGIAESKVLVYLDGYNGHIRVSIYTDLYSVVGPESFSVNFLLSSSSGGPIRKLYLVVGCGAVGVAVVIAVEVSETHSKASIT